MAKGVNDAGEIVSFKRKFHTRSRAGCTNCKQRHRRCDEKRPSCSKCVALKESCHYDVGIPRRERRLQTQPGEQTPWTLEYRPSSLPCAPTPQHQAASSAKPLLAPRLQQASTSWQLVPWQSVDPFEALPIEMPLKSKELLHYFVQGQHVPRGVANDSVRLIFQDPHGLQNLMLIAGVHYAWHVGDLSAFQSTYLFHKAQSIRTVNRWLEKGTQMNAIAVCAKHIATLCFIECYLGNVALAEMHLHGLIMYLEHQLWNNDRNWDTISAAERELTDRYLIICYSIVVRLRRPIQDTAEPPPPTNTEDESNAESTEKVKYFEHRSEVHDSSGSGLRLKCIRMFPFFFNLIPPANIYQQIDARPMVQCLKDITEVFNMRHPEAGKPRAQEAPSLDLSKIGWPRLLCVAVQAHMESLGNDIPAPTSNAQQLKSSWSGLCVANGMYMTGILHAWKTSSPIENRLLCHLLEILGRDAEHSLEDLATKSEESRDLWFWKVCIGAFNLAHAQSLASEKWFERMLADFTRYLRVWREVTGVTQWKEVKKILLRVAWPAKFKQEDAAEFLWNMTVLSKKYPSPSRWQDKT